MWLMVPSSIFAAFSRVVALSSGGASVANAASASNLSA